MTVTLLGWLDRLQRLGRLRFDRPARFLLRHRARRPPLLAGLEHERRTNRVVLVIGNHDIELNWPLVQEEIIRRMELSQDLRQNIRFCEWFYISNKDTFIEHGNQHDAYCVTLDPMHPLIKKGSKILVRISFGDMAGKLMINGIGLMNPHVESSFIKDTVREYAVFFYTYMARVQPFALWSWFWSALSTLVVTVNEGLMQALKDPLMIEERVEHIAVRSNAPARIVRLLRELRVHPAIFSPLRILRELWLDRLLFFFFVLFLGFQIYAVTNVFSTVSFWWFLVPVLCGFPAFMFYTRSVQSEVDAMNRATMKVMPLLSRVTGMNRVIHGHTHREIHQDLDGVEYVNPGTWSPGYHDLECTKPMGRKCVVWIKPVAEGKLRTATLYEWKDGQGMVEIAKT